MNYAVIMAGGIGSRFWPRSRQAHPKQFLNVFEEASLLQATVGRLQGLVPPERCFVVTHERYVEQTREQLPALPAENILAEPISRNTAPCIAFAATHLLRQDPDATLVVLPADHAIDATRRFQQTLQFAFEKAQERGALVTIGVKPTYAATGYGYIQYDAPDAPPEAPQAYWVKSFAEKPDLATAERFIDAGDFLWNSGMFIWRADSILDQIEKHLPELHHAFRAVAEADATKAGDVLDAFQKSPRISIDYGVMERADKVYVVPGDFGWSDVGDWRAVYDLAEKNDAGNAIQGNAILHDASRSLVHSDGQLVVLVGMHDTVVVSTADAVLVCHREATQRVKNVVDYLHAHNLDEYV